MFTGDFVTKQFHYSRTTVLIFNGLSCCIPLFLTRANNFGAFSRKMFYVITNLSVINRVLFCSTHLGITVWFARLR